MAVTQDVTSYESSRFPVGGIYGDMSPYMSCTGSIKAAAMPSWGVLLLLQLLET